MKKIIALTQFYSKSLLKQKATQLMVLLTVLFIGVSFLVSDINIATRFKLFEDVLLTSQMLLLHMSALFYTFEFLQNERLGGLYVLPLSTSMSRFQYLISVFLMIKMVLVMFLGVLLIVDSAVLYLLEGTIRFEVLWQLFLYFLSAQLLAFLIVMFSQYVSIMNSMIYALTLYFMGNALDELYYYAYTWKNNVLLQNIYDVLIYVVPNFSIFDKQGLVVNNSVYDTSEMYFEPLLYIIISVVIVFNIALYKFKRKALRLGE